jgi:hypothetical protein
MYNGKSVASLERISVRRVFRLQNSTPQNLKLPSLRVTGAVQLAGVENSRFPDVVG